MSSIALAAVTHFTTKPECHKKKGQHTIQSANPTDISPLCLKMQLNLLTAGYLIKEVKQSIGSLRWRPCNGIRTSYHWPKRSLEPFLPLPIPPLSPPMVAFLNLGILKEGPLQSQI